jgi:uncharacterized membrane protein
MSLRIERADVPRAPGPAHSSSRARRAAWVCLAALPLLGWAARANGEALLGHAFALAALALALGLFVARQRVVAAIATLVAAFVGALALARVVAPVYWPPIAWNLVASACFLASLRRRESLIESFARLGGEAMTDAVRTYCRRLTYVWAIWLALLGACGFAIGVAGDERLGAWWAAIIDYALVAALFVGEYAWRRFRQGVSHGLVAQMANARKGFRGARR